MSIMIEAPNINNEQLSQALQLSIRDIPNLRKILLIPPDITRSHSGAGKITALYYNLFKDHCQIDILPALGTHEPMTKNERHAMFGQEIPDSAYIDHHWKTQVVPIGTVPKDFVAEISGGLLQESIDIEINRRLLDTSYDVILSIGQVVPHEVVGMANYTKNIVVGCGGSRVIHLSHMLGALWGIEKLMGKDHSPVRQVFDYAENHFLKTLPLRYVLTVTIQVQGETQLHGLFIGRERSLFEAAVKLSQQKNIIYLPQPQKKIVVYLDAAKYKSTWLGNKAIYRTRLAIADDGELIIIAPGISKFGEDADNDAMIRQYGYIGREKILQLYRDRTGLHTNPAVAAHLIHGSSDDRFSITYCVEKLSQQEIEQVDFRYMSVADALERYPVDKLQEGENVLDNGETIYFIDNPAKALWTIAGNNPI